MDLKSSRSETFEFEIIFSKFALVVTKIKIWPSQSPDLNPIENLWGYIKKKLRKRTVKPSSLDRLFEFILEEWKAVPGQILENMVESMPRRIEQVVNQKGGSTKF